MTFDEFEKNITTNISQIIDDILLDSYVPEPLKKIEINKNTLYQYLYYLDIGK